MESKHNPGFSHNRLVDHRSNLYRKKNIYGLTSRQRYTYRVLQTIQMKLILLCVWAEPFLGSAKTTLKFKYEI